MPETGSTPERRTAEAMDIMDILAEAIAKGKGNRLSVRSMEFYIDTRDRLKQYGERTAITARQLYWLRDLKDSIL